MDRLESCSNWNFAHPFLAACVASIALVVSFSLYLLYRIFVRPLVSPVRHVPGPKSAHPLWGNMEEFAMKPPGRAHVEWAHKYGGAVRYRGLLGQDFVLLTDPVAMTHLLTNDPYATYEKPAELRGDLSTHLGKGVIFAEGEDHRHQRRMLTPAFAHGNLKAMLPTFFDLSYQLREIWTKRIENQDVDKSAWYYRKDLDEFESTKEEGEVVIEVADWVTRLSLDAIGKAGFGYDFDSLYKHDDPLSSAFYTLFAPRMTTIRIPPKFMLAHQVFGTILHSLPSMSWAKHLPDERFKAIFKACEDMENESRNIITAKREAVKRDGRESLKGKKDLISLLLAAEGPDSKFCLTPEELRGQLNSFLFAGHDTISETIVWVLWALSRDHARQDRLRQEIRTARAQALERGREELDSEDLGGLEFLDAVVRETLRLEPPLAATPRTAIKDDLIPLSTPVPSATDPKRLISHVPVKKGQTCWLGIYAANRNPAIFGDDAEEFRPERWIASEGGDKIESKMGIWSGQMTFLAGPRSCIGYKFALLEIKTVLSVLLDAFEFFPRNPGMEIERGTQVITRPFVKGEVHLGTRMPLKIRLAKTEE
ncbi:hypothetical protein JCM10212_005884 [Sporobolomyces blumeae]